VIQPLTQVEGKQIRLEIQPAFGMADALTQGHRRIYLFVTIRRLKVMSNATVTIRPGRMHRSVFDFKARLNYRIGFLTICFLTIAAISTLDIWFAVANSSILEVEQNPICRELIKLDQSGFSFFILGKALGTVTVLSTLTQLHRNRYRYASLVTVAITLFQLCLLTYMTLSDPLFYDLPNFSLLFAESPDSVWLLE
jgi:hypothetical protein